jgi:hypothetical protein
MPTGECLRCRYDLSVTPELPEGGVWKCPECGRINTAAEMAGDTGWSPRLVRGIVLGVLAVVNMGLGFGVGSLVHDDAAACEVVLGVCIAEVGVLLLLAWRQGRGLSWMTVGLFLLVLVAGGGLGLAAHTRVSRWMNGGGAAPAGPPTLVTPGRPPRSSGR